MKQVLVREGRIATEDVPEPRVEKGTLLVRVGYSCISAGTELGSVRESRRTLWQRALRDPAKVESFGRLVLQNGLSHAIRAVRGARERPMPLGYSLAGVVLEAGPGVHDIRVGDQVACAGTRHAHHAGLVRVPRNLAVPVPTGVSTAEASTVALGAIALQAVRRMSPTLGETVVVIGLGPLGLLTAQMLQAHGARVIGTDIDPSRVTLALAMGVETGIPAGGHDVEDILKLTGRIGADGVVITASSPSSAIISGAFRMCRRKGRVVLLGDVGLELDRRDIYEKEIDLLVSTSYGPGRYDPAYEEEGKDYPIGYVRWTENRNMSAYLALLANRRISAEPLIRAVFPVERAAEAFSLLAQGPDAPLTALLTYGHDERPRRRIDDPASPPAPEGRIRIALIGAGAFATAVHLPNLQRLQQHYALRAVASRSGYKAADVARRYGAAFATTDLAEVLADPQTDAVLIATRHDLHAAAARQALEAGKHVLVEKPLALTRAELADIVALFEDGSSRPMLLTAFNRRFSPTALRLKRLLDGRRSPAIISYRMNAGYIPPDNWVHGSEGGGRNLGEACHVYDLFTFLLGCEAVDVTARSIRDASRAYRASDNFVSTIAFSDGSVATLTYTALGSREHPKEQMEVFADGRVLVLDDYRSLTVKGGHRRDGLRSRRPDKGHFAMLEAFAGAVRSGEWPIPLWQQVQASEIALKVQGFLDPAAAGEAPRWSPRSR